MQRQGTNGDPALDKTQEAPKSKPYQCCLKEYGIKTSTRRSVQDEQIGGEDDQAKDDDYLGWERRWRMFGTTII